MSYQAITVSADADTGIIEEARRIQGQSYRTYRSSPVASAVAALSHWANDASVAWRVENEISAIRSQIDGSIRNWSDNNPAGMCYLPEQCGCLIHVILSTPANWPAGQRPLSFVTLFQAECGLDPAETLGGYLAVPNMFQGTPEGTEAIWRFVWVSFSG